MPGLVPGIHVFLLAAKTWMAGTSPAMTEPGDHAMFHDWSRNFYENAWMPVMARPRISAWTSCVPS
jgi:hypothetical protein